MNNVETRKARCGTRAPGMHNAGSYLHPPTQMLSTTKMSILTIPLMASTCVRAGVEWMHVAGQRGMRLNSVLVI
jgi:hypothetical protein